VCGRIAQVSCTGSRTCDLLQLSLLLPVTVEVSHPHATAVSWANGPDRRRVVAGTLSCLYRATTAGHLSSALRPQQCDAMRGSCEWMMQLRGGEYAEQSPEAADPTEEDPYPARAHPQSRPRVVSPLSGRYFSSRDVGSHCRIYGGGNCTTKWEHLSGSVSEWGAMRRGIQCGGPAGRNSSDCQSMKIQRIFTFSCDCKQLKVQTVQSRSVSR